MSDGQKEWLLCCDGFGTTLQPFCDDQLAESPKGHFEVEPHGKILWQNKAFLFPELSPIASFDVSGDVLAVTSTLSHSVFLFVGTLKA